MGPERIIRTIFYPTIFLIVLLGFHTQWFWFRFVGMVIVLYGLWRIVSVPCWHRFLALITGLFLIAITLFKVDSLILTMILGIMMLLDLTPM